MGAAASVGGGQDADVYTRLMRRHGAPREKLSAAEVASLRDFYSEQLDKHGDDEASAFDALSTQYAGILASHGGPRPAAGDALAEGVFKPLTSVDAEGLFDYLSSVPGMAPIAAQLGAAGVDGEMLAAAEVSDLAELLDGEVLADKGATGARGNNDPAAAEAAMVAFAALVVDLQQRGVPARRAEVKHLRATSAPVARGGAVKMPAIGGRPRDAVAPASGGGGGPRRIPLTMLTAGDVSKYLAAQDELALFVEPFRAAEIDGKMLAQADAGDVMELVEGCPPDVAEFFSVVLGDAKANGVPAAALEAGAAAINSSGTNHSAAAAASQRAAERAQMSGMGNLGTMHEVAGEVEEDGSHGGGGGGSGSTVPLGSLGGAQVATLLRARALDLFVPAFEAAGIDGAMLANADAEDLQELVDSAPPSTQARLVTAVQDAQRNGVPAELLQEAGSRQAAAESTPQNQVARRPLAELSGEEIGRCLAAAGLELFVEAFLAAGIDGPMLAQAEPDDVMELVEGAPGNMSARLQQFVATAQRDGVVVPDGFDGHQVRDPANPQVFLEVEIARGAGKRTTGTMVFELFHDITPKTAKNFLVLCKGDTKAKRSKQKLAYKGSKLHRIIPGFMLQGGDFTKGNGTGGLSIYGPKFQDENFKLLHEAPGMLSMANSGPNTNGSQFFVTLAPTPWLDGKHCIFGQIVKGFAFAQKLEKLGSKSGKLKGGTTATIVKCGEAAEKCGLSPTGRPRKLPSL